MGAHNCFRFGCRTQFDGFRFRLLRTLSYIAPYRVGIYGPSMVGKTTLDQYLTVPGDIDPIPYEMRTAHAKADTATGYRNPRSTRKQVRLVKEKKPISTTDLAGDPMFRNLWIEDMFGRKVELVIFMVDQSHDFQTICYGCLSVFHIWWTT